MKSFHYLQRNVFAKINYTELVKFVDFVNKVKLMTANWQPVIHVEGMKFTQQVPINVSVIWETTQSKEYAEDANLDSNTIKKIRHAFQYVDTMKSSLRANVFVLVDSTK